MFVTHLRTAAKLAFAFIFLLSAASCGRRFERPNIPPVLGLVAKKGEAKKGGRPRVDYTLESYKADMAHYDEAIERNDMTRAKLYRNKLIYSVMAEVDNTFGEYESRLFVDQGSVMVGSDFLQLGLSTFATLSPGARGKTVLASILSGVTGTNLSINKNFFRQQTIQAIMSSMEANRSRIKTTVLTQLKQEVSEYPIQAARSDLISYYYAGTLPGGLQQIHESSAVAATEQRINLNDTQMDPTHTSRKPKTREPADD